MRRPDLGLNTPKTISPPSDLLLNVTKRRKEDKIDQHAQRMRSCIDALEEEKRKIQVFHRELPLCLELVNNAIENYRQQWSGTTTECLHGGQSECSEQTSTQGPVLEEFIPIKRPCSGSDDDEDTELDSDRMLSDVKGTVAVAVGCSDNKRKSDWLRSAQLWNQTAPDPPPKDDPPPKMVPVLEVKRSGGGAFQLFNREHGAIVETGHMNKQSLLSLDKAHSTVPVAAARSTADIAAVSGRKEDREPAQPNRKQRRNWSPELHRRFLQALQQLGSSHAATPKQIRELMKVDGLTNDEVKSHLQKYRLHTRRTGPSTIPAAGTAQAPQFVVVGGIWVPPTKYLAVASGDSVEAPALYAPEPVNSGQQKQPEVSEGKGSHSAGGEEEEEAGGARSDSPLTSSSSHTTTTSRLH